jgi:hypothetical protein
MKKSKCAGGKGAAGESDILEAAKSHASAGQPAREEMQIAEQQDGIVISYYGEKIDTPEQLIEHAKIDLRIWEVVKITVNNWGVGGKIKRGQDAAGRWQPEHLWQQALRQIKIDLRRRAPKGIQDGIRELLADMKPLKLGRPARSKSSDPHMLEIGLFDHHFGKLCWGEETGTRYDVKIAEMEYVKAVDEMLDRVKGFHVEKIVMPIGNDFFHVNNAVSETANGTRVESTDDRFSKVFRVGCKAVRYAIERCREVADVEVLWVPGNHDRQTSWFLTEVLLTAFEGDKHVRIDNGPRYRKYMLYGPSLLGYTHGNEEKHSDYPTLMAVEAPDLWAKSTFRTMRIGHWHKKKETRYIAGDTFLGVEVVVFPSLCGTDLWHHMKGFVGNARMAMCYLWSRESGPVGSFTVHAKTPPVSN